MRDGKKMKIRVINKESGEVIMEWEDQFESMDVTVSMGQENKVKDIDEIDLVSEKREEEKDRSIGVDIEREMSR